MKPVASSAYSGDAQRVTSDYQETPQNLKQACDAFEAIFTGMLIKAMRQTSLGDGLLDSDAGKTFRDMQDREMAAVAGTSGSMGISKALQVFLTRQRPALRHLPGDASAVGKTSA
jgi:peptidoglycan hydrolase FlgJ